MFTKMSIPPPSEFARFRYFDQIAPPRIPDQIIGLSQEVAFRVENEPPPTIREIILHATQTNIKRTGSIDFYIFGTFQSHFRAIDHFADYLIPLYLQSGILPLIKPLTIPEWLLHYQNKGPVLQRITKSGWLLNKIG